MVIKKVRLENLYRYRGTHYFQFSEGVNRIFKENGEGKTSLLRGLQVGFGGLSPYLLSIGGERVSKREFVTGGERGEGLITSGERYGEIEIETDLFSVKRRFTRTSHRVEVTLFYPLSRLAPGVGMEPLPVGVPISGKKGEELLNRLFPKSLIPFLFFDGEQLERLANFHSPLFTSWLEEVTGGALFRRGEEDLKRLGKRVVTGGDRQLTRKIREVEGKLKELRRKLREVERGMEQIEGEIWERGKEESPFEKGRRGEGGSSLPELLTELLEVEWECFGELEQELAKRGRLEQVTRRLERALNRRRGGRRGEGGDPTLKLRRERWKLEGERERLLRQIEELEGELESLLKGEGATGGSKGGEILKLEQLFRELREKRLESQLPKIVNFANDFLSKFQNKKVSELKFVAKPPKIEISSQGGGGRGRFQPVNSLSAGERQLVVMALLWGVMEYLNWRYPVVIDTPLARLDQTSRQLVETHLFSNPPGQLILLLTSAEKVEWGKPKTPSFKLSETFTPLQIEN